MPWNTFSTHDLIAFWVSITLAITYALIYWRRGRQITDLLLAGVTGCTAVVCLIIFLEDNVVPKGALACEIDGADRALLLLRVKFVLTLLAMAFQFHFVLRYCRRWTILRRTMLMYAAFLAQIPLVCSAWFCIPRSFPSVAVSDWRHAVPWMPIPGPLLSPCLALWGIIQVYLHFVLWQYKNRTHLTHAEQVHLGLIRLAMIVQAAGFMMDAINGFFGFTGVSVVPLSSVMMVAFFAVAISRRGAVSGEPGAAPPRGDCGPIRQSPA